jgi:phosphatidylglycerophosphatase C
VTEPRAVAAFDFDGTLTPRDTVVPFLARVAGWPTVTRGLVRAAPSFVAPSSVSGRDRAKEHLLRTTVAGRPSASVVATGREYGAWLTAHRIRPEMRERLAWHRSAGHEVIIVSASLDVYLEEVAQRLEVDGLACTTLEVDGDGRCTGRMVGGNCRGPAKAERLRAWLGDGPVALWAYGDSSGDDEMLAMADHPTRVGGRAHG